jgi:hypothetical protein
MLYYHVNRRVIIVWHWEIILSNVLNFDSIGVIFLETKKINFSISTRNLGIRRELEEKKYDNFFHLMENT